MIIIPQRIDEQWNSIDCVCPCCLVQKIPKPIEEIVVDRETPSENLRRNMDSANGIIAENVVSNHHIHRSDVENIYAPIICVPPISHCAVSIDRVVDYRNVSDRKIACRSVIARDPHPHTFIAIDQVVENANAVNVRSCVAAYFKPHIVVIELITID